MPNGEPTLRVRSGGSNDDEHCAQAADPSLTQSELDAPGIRRRSGRGFRYFAPDGTPPKDEVALARIKALVIPPAWEED